MSYKLLMLAVPVVFASALLGQKSQNKQEDSGIPPVQTAVVPTISELIKVTIYPSRNEVVPTGSYGVFADLENVSALPVMIFPHQTALIVLPEASEPSACVNWQSAIFPTEAPILNNRTPPKLGPLEFGQAASAAGPASAAEKTATLWDSPLIIQRGEHYVVFWDLEPAPEKDPPAYSNKCTLPPKWYSALGFVPGDYAFTVEGNAFALQTPASSVTPKTTPGTTPTLTAQTGAMQNEPETSRDPVLSDFISKVTSGKTPTHHFSETKTLHVGLSQITTLIAAMIGGFFAYWVIALRPGQDWDAFMQILDPDAVKCPGDASSPPMPASRKWLAGLSLIRNSILAAFLGGVVTIVASRLSDTHFPIKVSVSDWWGALTIGFVSFFIGNKFIDSLSSLGSSNSGSTLGKPPTPTPVVPIAPTNSGNAAK